MFKFVAMIRNAKLNREIAEVETKLLNSPTKEDFDKYTRLVEKRNEI